MTVEKVKYIKSKGNCEVTFKEFAESYYISLDLINKYRLSKDKEITAEEFEEIISEQRVFDVKKTAFNYASFKPRSEKQLEDKLKQKEFNEDEIEIAKEFLKSFDLLDDRKFAILFVNNFLKRKSAGQRVVKMELMGKGIDEYLAEEILQDHFPHDEVEELISKAADKKMRLLSNKAIEKQKKSLTDHLLMRGFPWEKVKIEIDKRFKKD